MANPEAILQLARLVGRADFDRALGVEAGAEPSALAAAQRERLHELVDARLEPISEGLVQEAMASDDVHDAASAGAYLEDRLAFLNDLLTSAQRDRLRAAFQARIATWEGNEA